METNIVLPAWYESSAGPGISATLTNVAANVLPLVNFMLMSRGINILPATLNFWISFLVFVVISIRTGVSYVRAKRIFGAQIARLKRENEALGAQLGRTSAGPGQASGSR